MRTSVDALSESIGSLFVTVGNATQPFARLLKTVNELLSSRVFSVERVSWQVGANPDFIPCVGMVDRRIGGLVFEKRLAEADVVIAHAGAGTLLNCFALGKVPCVMPRERRFGEAVDDHQTQLAEVLLKERRILVFGSAGILLACIMEARNAAAPAGSTSSLSELIKEDLRSVERGRWRRNVYSRD